MADLASGRCPSASRTGPGPPGRGHILVLLEGLDIRCRDSYHHCIMARTTLDIDAPILREIKALQKKEGRSMGQIVSQLLAEALTRRRAGVSAPTLKWVSRPMGALVDLSDKEALYAVLDQDRE